MDILRDPLVIEVWPMGAVFPDAVVYLKVDEDLYVADLTTPIHDTLRR